MPTEVVDHGLDRLRQASVDVEDAREALRDRIRLRDRIVVELVDAGYNQRAIAKAMGLSLALVTQILARPE